jgi:aspartyl protease family protein
MGAMDFHQIGSTIAAAIAAMPRSGLLLATVGAVLLGVAGSMLARPAPWLGRAMRRVSTVGLACILVLVVLQISRFDPRFEMAIPEIGLPEQEVAGGETRVPLAPDGHFWVRARVNGVAASFLIDTGASITTLNTRTAEAAGMEPRAGGIPIMMQTANGTATAQLATIDSLRFGNIAARGLDAAIAPNIGPTNVIGMNLLARLASWRVEDNTMFLTPHHPQPDEDAR